MEKWNASTFGNVFSSEIPPKPTEGNLCSGTSSVLIHSERNTRLYKCVSLHFSFELWCSRWKSSIELKTVVQDLYERLLHSSPCQRVWNSCMRTSKTVGLRGLSGRSMIMAEGRSNCSEELATTTRSMVEKPKKLQRKKKLCVQREDYSQKKNDRWWGQTRITNCV